MGISLKRSCITGESDGRFPTSLGGLGLSLLNIVVAYLYCIALLHISIAYLYCISLSHIFETYLYSISLCRVVVFCCLGLGSILDRFGCVFVGFLVVLGGLRGVLVSPSLPQRPRRS